MNVMKIFLGAILLFEIFTQTLMADEINLSSEDRLIGIVKQINSIQNYRYSLCRGLED